MRNCELFWRYTSSPEGIWFLCPPRILHLGAYRALIFPISVWIWRPFLSSLAHCVASRALVREFSWLYTQESWAHSSAPQWIQRWWVNGWRLWSWRSFATLMDSMILLFFTINGLHAVHSATIILHSLCITGNTLYAHLIQHTTPPLLLVLCRGPSWSNTMDDRFAIRELWVPFITLRGLYTL